MDPFVLIRQLQGAVGGRIIRGTVSDAGAVVNGTGFTPAQIATGIYSVTFDDAFRTVPTVVVGPGSTGGAYGVKVSTAPSVTGFGAITYITTSAVNTDGEWHFIAIG